MSLLAVFEVLGLWNERERPKPTQDSISQQLSQIKRLPKEILLVIVEECCANVDNSSYSWMQHSQELFRQFLLCTLLRVCRTWYHHLLPDLYKTVAPKNDTSYLQLIDTLQSDASLGSLVKNLKFPYYYSWFHREGGWIFGRSTSRLPRLLVALCPNLEELTLHLPPPPTVLPFTEILTSLPSLDLIHNLKSLELSGGAYMKEVLQHLLDPNLVLPQLEQLRLNRVCLSDLLLWPTMPRLRRIIIETRYQDDVQNLHKLLHLYKTTLRSLQIHRHQPEVFRCGNSSPGGDESLFHLHSLGEDVFKGYLDVIYRSLAIVEDTLEDLTFSYPDYCHFAPDKQDPSWRNRNLSQMTSLTTLRIMSSLIYMDILLRPPPRLHTLVLFIHYEQSELWTLSDIFQRLPITLKTVIFQVDTGFTGSEWTALYERFKGPYLMQDGTSRTLEVAEFQDSTLKLFADRGISAKIERFAHYQLAQKWILL